MTSPFSAHPAPGHPAEMLASRPGGDPVLVIGNGPVGQTAALLLRRWGLDVLLVDGRAERDPIGSKAICQARDVLDIWETVGAGSRLAAEGVNWHTARTYYRDQEIAAWSFVDSGSSPFPACVNISQQRTEELLDERIAAAGITVLWGWNATAFGQDDAGVTVTLSDGEARRTVRASHVLVATGARSDEIRRELGLSFDGRSYSDYFLICDIRADLPGWEHERRFYFDPDWNPGRQVLIHACPGSTYRIDWQVPPTYDLNGDVASGGLDRRIRKVIGDRDYEIVWKSVYRFHQRSVDRMQLGRILLAGDVAHLVAPFGARGLNSGVCDAENAAWKIAFAAHGWAREDLLNSYDGERLRAAKENLEVTSATMHFLVPQTDADREQRHQILEAAATDQAVAADVDSGRFTEPYWYVDSPLITADPQRPFAGRPPKGRLPAPAPGILVPDVPITVPGHPDVTRLRQIARDGILLLAGPAVELEAVTTAAKKVTGAPVTVLAVSEIDSTGALGRSLNLDDGEVWVIRPDAYVAAVIAGSNPREVGTAIRVMLGGRR